jgi:rod shape determining protein RodA
LKHIASSSFLWRSLIQSLQCLDWLLIAAISLLLAVGLTTLSYQGSNFHSKQCEFLLAGLVACFVFARIPYLFWSNKIVLFALYGINLILLGAVMVMGHSAMGAQRWLALGPLTLQPSEIAKLVVIFSLAAWLAKYPIIKFWDCFKALAIIAVPAFLVFKQPDLGTSLTFGTVFLGVIFWAGATVLDLVVIFSPILSLIFNALNPALWWGFLIVLFVLLIFWWRKDNWTLVIRVILSLAIVIANIGMGELRPKLWGVLKPYQQKRLTSFINPYDDPRGSGYHILQSLIAIGNGGIFGAGLGRGNQSQGAFIPERHTDFIFAVVSEELGFRISALVVLAYSLLCIRAALIAYQARSEPFGSLVAIGIMFMFLFHVFLNIGMTIGIMPVAGVPLPFLSYGGTALIIDMSAIGILLSIHLLNPPPRKDIWT